MTVPTQADANASDEIFLMAQEKLREVSRLLGELAAALEAAAAAAAAAFGAWVIEKIREFNQWRVRTEELLGKLTSNLPGDASAIRKLGDDWVQQVGGPAIAQAQELSREKLPSYGRWTGAAADVYFIGVGLGQIKALEAVRNATNEINESMKAIASAITSFWTSVGIAVGALLGGLAGALTASGTIVGIPAGVVLAVGAVVVFGSLVADAIFGLGNALNDTRLFSAAENAAFNQAGWPTLVSKDVLSDGSANDGGPSAWKLPS